MPATLMDRNAAEILAAQLNTSDSEGWTYAAEHPEGAGLSRVSVSDETGAFVAYL